MIKTLTTSLIKDLLLVLKNEKGFYELSQEKKQHLSHEKLTYDSLVEYICSLSATEFVHDLEKTLKNLRNMDDIKTKKSIMLKTLTNFFLNDFPDKFDHLNKDYHLLGDKERHEKLKNVFPGKSNFVKSLREYLLLFSVQEMSEYLVDFIRQVYSSPIIIVQSPIECKTSIKKSIREHFAGKHPHSFLIFSINSQLIGGIRFIVDGKVKDYSWFSRIQSLHQLSNIIN